MYTWEEHERRLLAKVALPFSRNQFVLEVGCGEGIMSYVLAEQVGNVVGVDIQSNAAWKELSLKLVNL